MACKGKTDVFCDCHAEQGWHPLVAEIPVLVQLPGHPKALPDPRIKSLIGKTHEPVTFSLFLFVLRIPSTAWALYQDILLGISTLSPILSLQPDLKFYFIFLRQRIQRDGTKLSPCSLLILQPHQSILPLHHPMAAMAVLNVDLLCLQVPHNQTPSDILGKQEAGSGSGTEASIHIFRQDILSFPTDLNACKLN